jgi:nucleotide-binding universal stress UspA family protein
MKRFAAHDRSDAGAGLILVGIDGSTTSLHAEAWAVGQARARGSRLLGVFVVTHPAFAELALSAGGDVPADLGAGEQAEELLRELRIQAEAYHLDAEFLVRSGDPATEIERIADEYRADELVVGASAKARHRLVGSVARRLVHSARWPVTVVP